MFAQAEKYLVELRSATMALSEVGLALVGALTEKGFFGVAVDWPMTRSLLPLTLRCRYNLCRPQSGVDKGPMKHTISPRRRANHLPVRVHARHDSKQLLFHLL